MDGELDQLGERIAEQAAHFDAAMHRLLADLRVFDERGGWHRQGALSCAHWLAWRVGWDLVTARERVRVARKLAEFSLIDDALRRGEVSYSKVRAMLRVATPANESMLLDHARLMTASHLEKLCRKYALVQRHGEESSPQDDEERRFVRRREMVDGMIKIEAVLHPEEAELVWKMLDHAAAQIARSAEVACSAEVAHSAELTRSAHGRDAGKIAFDRADALMALAQAYLRGDQPNRTPIEVVLTIPRSRLEREAVGDLGVGKMRVGEMRVGEMSVDEMDVGEVGGDEIGVDEMSVGEIGETFVSAEAARRLSCDAGVVEIVESDDGVPLSVGRKQRTISGSLKRALHRRDAHCSFPGCTHRIFLEGHHIKHWADGGETSLANTALLCTAHHRYVHEYGYTIELGADHRPCFRDPRGRLMGQVPDRPELPTASLGWPQLYRMNAPLSIDADTIACGWDGSVVDYGTIVGHLGTIDELC